MAAGTTNLQPDRLHRAGTSGRAATRQESTYRTPIQCASSCPPETARERLIWTDNAHLSTSSGGTHIDGSAMQFGGLLAMSTDEALLTQAYRGDRRGSPNRGTRLTTSARPSAALSRRRRGRV